MPGVLSLTSTDRAWVAVVMLLLPACSNSGTGGTAVTAGDAARDTGRETTVATNRPALQTTPSHVADIDRNADRVAPLPAASANASTDRSTGVSASADGDAASTDGWSSVSIDNTDAVAGTRIIALADIIAQVALDPPTQGTLLIASPGHALHEATAIVRGMCNGASTQHSAAAPGTYDSITRHFDVTAALARFRGCTGELDGTITVSGKVTEGPPRVDAYRLSFSRLRYITPSYALTMTGTIEYAFIGGRQHRVVLNLRYRDQADRQYRAENLALDFIDRGFTDTVSISGHLHGPDQRYGVATINPISLSATTTYPLHGMLLLTAQDNSKLAVLYQSMTHYELWVDGGDGDSAMLEKSASCTWAAGCSALN